MSKLSAYNLARSFKCAFIGILRSLWYERNLRIHFFAAAYVLYFLHYFILTKGELAIVFLMLGLVIVCELINTAIEATVDLNTPDYNALAKTAKDAAAGAVLASAVASIAVGVTLFWQPKALQKIWHDILSAPFVWLFLIAITIFLIAWPERRQMSKGTAKAKNFNIKSSQNGLDNTNTRENK